MKFKNNYNTFKIEKEKLIFHTVRFEGPKTALDNIKLLQIESLF